MRWLANREGVEIDRVEAAIQQVDAPRRQLPRSFPVGRTGRQQFDQPQVLRADQAAGQTVFHLHVHVIPRYEGDVDDPGGGIRYVLPDKARYWEP